MNAMMDEGLYDRALRAHGIVTPARALARCHDAHKPLARRRGRASGEAG